VQNVTRDSQNNHGGLEVQTKL